VRPEQLHAFAFPNTDRKIIDYLRQDGRQLALF
jgi:hypothetical protein